jgi:hypothetical protein
LTSLSNKNIGNKKIILTGDYNINLLEFKHHIPTGEFVDCMTSKHFLPMILRPTRITPTSATLIDNIFINAFECVVESAIITHDISDHLPIMTWLDLEPITYGGKASNVKYTRSVNDTSILSLRNLLSETDWTPIVKSCNNDIKKHGKLLEL